MPSLKTAVSQFRSAVSAGAFAEAEQLLEAYRRDVEASWNTATSEHQRLEIVMEVSEVFEWARAATLVARSHTQRKLILLGRQSAYMPGVQNPEVRPLDA